MEMAIAVTIEAKLTVEKSFDYDLKQRDDLKSEFLIGSVLKMCFES